LIGLEPEKVLGRIVTQLPLQLQSPTQLNKMQQQFSKKRKSKGMRYCTCFAFGPETVSSSIEEEEVTLGTNAEVLLLESKKNKKRMLLGLH
jgi:hypothetical protein